MSSAACGGHTDTIVSHPRASAATVPTSRSPAASARLRVASLRPSEAQATSWPRERGAAPIVAPISPGWSRPTVTRASRQAVVGDERRELRELLAECDLREDVLCLGGGVDARDLLAHARLVEAAVLHPRPDLCTRDLGGRQVLHEVVDRRGAGSGEPRVEVADADGDVRAQPVAGDLAACDAEVEQLPLRDLDLVAQTVELVLALELRQRDGDEVGMGDPGAVEAVAGLAPLVLGHLLERDLVHLGVAARGDERGHP